VSGWPAVSSCNPLPALCVLQRTRLVIATLHIQYILQTCAALLLAASGYNMPMPLMVAPMAMHGLAHSDKELGTARAAAAVNVPVVRVWLL
jgi:hypothetical protein